MPEKGKNTPVHYEEARLAKLGLDSLCTTMQTAEPAKQAHQLEEVNEPTATSSTTVEDKTTDLPLPSVIVLHVFAKADEEFIGYELLQAILSYGFRFGDMDIFHRHQKADGHGKVLFSLASALEPGTFDVNTMGSYRTVGLTLFMPTDGVKNPLAVFDLMVNTAQSLSEDLDGILMDAEHMALTSNTVADLRHRLHHLSQHAEQAELDFS